MIINLEIESYFKTLRQFDLAMRLQLQSVTRGRSASGIAACFCQAEMAARYLSRK